MQKFPAASFRVEDGPVKFGEDWPGTFFRGDTSAGIASRLRWLSGRPDTPEPAQAFMLHLAEEFEKCLLPPS